MAMTYDNATNILETHRFLISSSPQQWGEFLQTSCKFEAYNFNNQIMIAAQRINPTAVADYDHWNNVQECSVIKGRKGIALFNEYGKGLRYVFDAADVRECHDKGKNGHKPSLWTVEERHHDMIMRGLEERYGSLLLKKDNLEDTIKEYVNQCVGEYILGNADLLAMSNEIHALMFSSAEFAILSRMGFAPKVEDYPAFEHITSYAMNREVISAIGMVTQKVSFPFLREIGREIYAYDLSHVAELGMETVFEQRKDFTDRFIETMDKNANLGLANASEGVHNAFDANGGEGANFEEVKDDARIDVHEGGRLSVSEHRSESATGGTDDQIRENESGIFEGTQGGTVSSDAGRWDIGGTLSGDSALSGSENGTADRTDDGGRGDFRSSEERGAHGVGSQDELHSRQSRRNRASGSSLRLEFTGEEPKYEQLSLFAPAEEEQIGTIMAKGSHSSSVLPEAFSLSMSQMQELLATGGGRTHSRERIWNQYSIGKSPEEISEFLKTEYETTGKGFQVDGHNISMWTDENGIYVGYGESAKETPIDIKIGAGREDIAHGFLSWTEAENLIRKTVREGEYLSAGEAFLTPQIVQKELADEIYYITESYQTTVLPQHHHYSDDMVKITELLSSKEGITSVCDALKDIIAKAEAGELSQRFRSIYTLEGTLAKVEDFARERISLPAKEEVAVRTEDFITQDEIDYDLTGGSGFSHGKLRIYEQFLSEKDSKTNAEFLKKEYGTGGRSHALPGSDVGHEDHDAKGIRLNKGHFGNAYTNILLNWNAVEKRIRALILADKYLSPKDKLEYKKYKAEKELKALKKAQKELNPAKTSPESVGEYAPIVLNDEKAAFLGEKPIYGIWSYALKDTVRDESGAELSFASEEEAAEHISVLNNETNVDTFISKTQGNELSVGDIIRHKGSLWEVTEIGFQTNFSNVNPKEMASIFSHIGNIENFDEWEHVSNANRKVTLNLDGAEEMILLDKWELADISYTLAKNSENEIVVHAQREDVSVTERVADVRLSREEIQSIYAEKFSLARLIEEPIKDAVRDENEAELSIEDITITCEWSESNVFEDGKTYSVYEFDKIMFDADSAKQERRAELIAQYGSEEEAIEADRTNLYAFIYDKTKFHVNFPDGKEPLVERQDIGDGDGGVIGFFRAFAEREKDENGKYHTIVKMLEEQREKDIRALGIESPTHSQEQKETVRIAGFLCDKVDEWETDAVTGEDAAFVIGYDKETETYFAKAEQNVFQFPVCPTREEVQDRYFNALGETDRDRNEQNLRQSRGISDEDIKEYLERKTAINNRYENDFSVDLETTVNHLHELRDEWLINFSLSESEFDVLVFDYIARHKEQEQEPTVPEETQTAAPSMTKASNFRITDDALGVGGAKAKFERNILAIETLKKIEEENRDASPDEQIILSNYVGWGGLSDAFDENKENWSKEYAKLKELLTPEEYSAARRSTLDSFYTSPTIIRAIYSKLSDMGFEKGNVLEPACGVGNFFGMMPEQMQKDSRLYGVELDSLSGRIAQKLYPDANIQIAGYENTSFSADFFDVAIGNVPFGEIKPYDKAYAKENFLIHDYFFAKTLDKVRAGGVIAFVTSKGTLDKQSEEVRKYIAERAEFLGAVRLPDTAFKANAGTDVTSDIIFLKKRDLPIVLSNNNMPEWVSLATDEKGISMNRYFAEHPEQICGSMEMVSGPFGPVSTCKENPEKSLSEQLESAMGNIHGKIDKSFVMKQTEHQEANVLPADDSVRNFSFTVIKDKVYYRRNSIMEEVEGKPDTLSRIKDMCAIRDAVQDVLNVQLENTNNDELFREKQVRLNQLYDGFEKKYGRIASRTNKKAFENDTSYCLLKSLEKFDEDGNFKEKAAIFSKRTVKPIIQIESCDNSMDALFASLSEKATIDFDYMSSLCGRTREEMISELMGVIYKNPETEEYETAEEYLSGNVRRKLELARGFVEQGQTEYAVNVESLEKVQPEELKASDIAIRLGATWIEPEYINQFMKETFEMPERLFRKQYYWMTDSLSECGVTMNPYTSEWTLRGKSAYHNAIIDSTYGSARRNALQILEDSLNLKTSQVYDIVEDPITGKEQRKLNEKETIIVQQKQELLKEKFNDWIFADPERREHLVTKYNQMFNCTRPRTYDGSHLTFKGIANGITLKDHQKDAIARVLYGGNSLLAHGVGAGKTYEMVAAAMESKRLGLCNKSLFVVPNHLTEQWGASFMKLYPNANILVATKKDFEPANRKEFCSRIATGDYDAVIIGHSQFERIPLSQEQISLSMENQIADIQMCIDSAKEAEGKKSPTVKQLERQKQSLERKLLELNDAPKDDVVTFEQLGVDRLFVDESHEFKNCAKRCRTR